MNAASRALLMRYRHVLEFDAQSCKIRAERDQVDTTAGDTF